MARPESIRTTNPTTSTSASDATRCIFEFGKYKLGNYCIYYII